MPEYKKVGGGKAKIQISEEQRLFQKDSLSYFLFKKTERLTSALYLVTGLFSIDEPLREALRTRGLKVMSFIAQGTEKGEELAVNDKNLYNSITELVALLNVGFLGGYISKMNHKILDDKYRELLNIILENKDRLVGPRGKIFSDDFFDIPKVSLRGQENELWGGSEWPEFSKNEDKGHLGKLRPLENKPPVVSPRALPVSSKGGIGSRSKGQINSSKKDRRGSILRFVNQKQRVSVKEVAGLFDDCSEKTVQRELLTLVEEGLLKKEGERRWSTYIPAK